MAKAKVKTVKYDIEKLSVTIGQGVLGKDGLPFNPAIIMATSMGRPIVEGGEPVAWSSSFNYSIPSLLILLCDEKYTEIKVVDELNNQWVIRK